MSVEKPIRIVLADDHPVVRIGVRNMLSEKEGFEVVGDATDGDEVSTGMRAGRPRFAATLPGLGGHGRENTWLRPEIPDDASVEIDGDSDLTPADV